MPAERPKSAIGGDSSKIWTPRMWTTRPLGGRRTGSRDWGVRGPPVKHAGSAAKNPVSWRGLKTNPSRRTRTMHAYAGLRIRIHRLWMEGLVWNTPYDRFHADFCPNSPHGGEQPFASRTRTVSSTWRDPMAWTALLSFGRSSTYFFAFSSSWSCLSLGSL